MIGSVSTTAPEPGTVVDELLDDVDELVDDSGAVVDVLVDDSGAMVDVLVDSGTDVDVVESLLSPEATTSTRDGS